MPTMLFAPTRGGAVIIAVAELSLDNVHRLEQAGDDNLAGARARLLLDADVPLGFLVVYSPAGKDYFCVEPVSHCTDAFNLAAQGRADTGMLTLEVGASVSAVMRLRPSLE
jgi:hypothetical protein